MQLSRYQMKIKTGRKKKHKTEQVWLGLQILIHNWNQKWASVYSVKCKKQNKKPPRHQGHHKVLKETQTSEQKEGKTKGLSRLISVEKNVGNSCGELQCLLGLK